MTTGKYCAQCDWYHIVDASKPGFICVHCGTPNIPGGGVNMYKPTTQKGIGVQVLKNTFQWGSLQVPSVIATLPLDIKDDDPIIPYIHYPVFARPCPLTPRHGFVDSRVVKSWEELKGVIEETRLADPKGEVMLMSPIKAKFNGVWVPNLLTIGEGNDGATAGKSTITFPLAGMIDPLLTPSILKAAKIGEDQDPYIETVIDVDWTNYITQLRAGPKLEGCARDYIPLETKVEKIIKVDPKMDLLAWEKLIQDLGGEPEGVVVYHPGGSPADHFSVHARCFHIPVLTTREPIVGETLTPISTPTLDPMGVLRGIVIGDQLKLVQGTQPNTISTNDAVNFLLHTLHHSAAMGGENSWYVGVGVALMLRLGTTACKGEARHIRAHHGARETMYARILPKSICRQRVSLPGIVNILRYGTFSGSVGGPKWAQCGRATADLFDAVGLLAKDPSPASVDNLMRVFNVVVNQAHNGGWWLNKFISSEAFDNIQKGSLTWTTRLIPALWELNKFKPTVSDETVIRLVSKLATWKPLQLKPVKPQKVFLTTVPGVNGLVIKVENKLLKDRHRPIVVRPDELLTKLPLFTKGRLYMEVGPLGMKVLIHNTPHEEPVVLYEENGIELVPFKKVNE